jgi:ABC-2 type transport system permease protein
MKALYWKELNAFFSDLSGVLILVLFLITLGLIVWVFPQTSVLEYGYADLEPLFLYTPYVFIFLIPAITMKMIAEEKKTGTWELLRTSPLSTFEIILAKYFAAITLIFIAIIPTLVYFYSVLQLGNPPGNLDQAGFFGSWIGLYFLGAVFAAIGIFSSMLTQHQIIAFLIAVFFSFFMYFGWKAISELEMFRSINLTIEFLSLSYHFDSMGRGVIEAQNIFYFLSIIAIMLGLTGIGIVRK